VRYAWLILCGSVAAHAEIPGMVSHLNAPVPMRDGVVLAANVFRPGGQGRFPTILVRTPYGKGVKASAHHEAFVRNGYAVVVEDVRGRYDSEGTFQPLTQEPRDGYDTLEWIARQVWSDGSIGMMGGSYLGIVQWKVAALNNPHLKAIFPVVSGYDDYRDRFYSPGGAMKVGHRLLWISQNMRPRDFRPPAFLEFVRTIPIRRSDLAATSVTNSMLQWALDHPEYDVFWRRMSIREQIGKVRVPVFSVGGWYDNFCQSDLEAFAATSKISKANRTIVGPWPHNMSVKFKDVDFGPESSAPLRSLQIQWFDQWLKGKPAAFAGAPPLRLFVMGANRWRDEWEWPLARARLAPLYLASGGNANSLGGGGRLTRKPPRQSKPDSYLYNPADPAPTRGGAVCCNPNVFPWGPMDQRGVEQRNDVLVYTSDPMPRDLEVTGPIEVILYVSTTARDTDFTAKLVDVFPDGHARNLTDGILRLRYRNALERAELATPGEVCRITIDAGVTSNVFLKGHAIRLEISSSNFPRFDRNPNTGRLVADETEFRTATQTVYHDRARPSQIVLPVVE
jgi:putative CocE/NonD family hydrolase